MPASSASQRCAAWTTMPWKTASRLPGLSLISCRISDRRRLQFERLGQLGVALFDLAEQACVVDGNGGLVGERLQQGDLVVGVPARLRAGEADRADRDTAAHHRHGERALVAHRSRRRGGVGRCVLAVPVSDVDDLAAQHGRAGDRRLVDRYDSRCRPGRRRRVPVRRPRSGAVRRRRGRAPWRRCPAQPVRVLGHLVEHRLQIESCRCSRRRARRSSRSGVRGRRRDR